MASLESALVYIQSDSFTAQFFCIQITNHNHHNKKFNNHNYINRTHDFFVMVTRRMPRPWTIFLYLYIIEKPHSQDFVFHKRILGKLLEEIQFFSRISFLNIIIQDKTYFSLISSSNKFKNQIPKVLVFSVFSVSLGSIF